MPVMKCSLDGKNGYKWGEGGTCYTYTEGDAASESAAKSKAEQQGQAIHANKFKIAKTVDDEQLVFGWANVAIRKDGSQIVDFQEDVVDPEDLEYAAYDFNLNYRTTGEMHTGVAKGHMIESVVFTKQKQAAMGLPEGAVPEAWWVGFYVEDPQAYAKVKSGEYSMLSIQGRAIREEI